MGYEDEALIRAMNQHKAGCNGDIHTGIYIREKLYRFTRENLFANKMSILLPEDFVDMPHELARLKYPMEQRPTIIKMNEEGSLNFTFNHFDMDVTNEIIIDVKSQMKKILKQAYPANVFYEDKLVMTGTIKIPWFAYKSHGLDEKIYNLMYFLPLGGKLLHGMFNSPLKDADLWKPVVLQMIQTIEDLTIDEEVRYAR